MCNNGVERVLTSLSGHIKGRKPMANTYPELGAEDARPQLGRNLTYGMLDSLGRAIVTGQYDNGAYPTEA